MWMGGHREEEQGVFEEWEVDTEMKVVRVRRYPTPKNLGNHGHCSYSVTLNKNLYNSKFHFHILAPASPPSPRGLAHYPHLNLIHPTAKESAVSEEASYPTRKTHTC